jgi:hypothetical protein
MTTIRPYRDQSLFDVALVQFGNIEQAFELALENDISLTGDITGLELNTVLVANKPAIVNYYRNNNITPATALKADELLGGIGYMGIEIDFIVS